jgi:UDP-GlcNAc:undecaprenyl-phosphate/decaprenyl-phosphate GlcNAc-1-phosphate transferase
MPPLGAYAVVAVVAAVGTYVAMFPLRSLAVRIGFVAEPDERRIHTRVTPYGGGVAMFVAFLVAMMVASQIPQLRSVFQGSSEPLGVVLGAAVIFAVGLADDIRDMSAPAKMAGEVLAAMVLVYLGVTMVQFKIPLVGFIVLSSGSQWIPLLTALWVIVITNAVNLIDGLDGLATGIVAIASGALAVYGIRLVDQGQLSADNLGPLIAVIAFGVCIGFLPHNFHPARAFMGDAGALFLGLLMAAATMEIGGRQPEGSGQTFFFFAPLFIPLFILGVPIADMAFAFVRRTAKGTGFHTPDLDHVHYRLLRLGHGPRRTVVILWAWTALLSGFLLYPLFVSKANAIIPFGVVVLGLALYTLFHPGLRKDAPPVEDEGAEERPVLAPGPGAGHADGEVRDETATASGSAPDQPRSSPPNGRGATPQTGHGAYGVPVAAPVVAPEPVADSN